MTPTPEQEARQHIDSALEASGWILQDRSEINLAAGRGVAVREFKMADGHGFADYMLFVDGKAAGVLEAKPAGYTLSSVELQAEQYATGLPAGLDPPVDPLPFRYLSTGVETRFVNGLDPKPRSRPISFLPHVHRPETLADWLASPTLDAWVKERHAAIGAPTSADDTVPSSLRARLAALPPLARTGLRDCQFEAITNLEHSLARNHSRALVQMATGSGKTFFAISEIYRLIRFGGARRVLFLVDRKNLGEQAEREFQAYRTPDGNRKLTDLYTVQLLRSNSIASASKVVITTIQRLYSILKGEPEFEGEREEGSAFLAADPRMAGPMQVVYDAGIPPEFFDFVFVDECHRSIYSLWRQVLEYFDAFLIGLTATPAKHTFGFFRRNLVMEYSHDRAVADDVNVDFEVYPIRTRITETGSRIEAGDGMQVGYRDKKTRALRWEEPDEDVQYGGEQLDRSVVARDQIRLVIRTLRDRTIPDMFPDRDEVPKTLIFAKSDSHAEDIVEAVREEFGEGNDFCQKITYKATARKPKTLITEFRNRYNPRVAVTVDMIATGTDIKPIEVVVFMRTVRSRGLFEQMKGRGVRTIDVDELKAVSPSAPAKTHFVLVDCVGQTETTLVDSQPLERCKGASFASVLEHVAIGGKDPDILSSLASRLARLSKQCGPEEHARVAAASGGPSLADMSRALVDGLDPDRQAAEARRSFDVPADEEPTASQVEQAAGALLARAAEPIATNPALRTLLEELRQDLEQIIDEVSEDELLEAGGSEAATARARDMVASFEQFLEENRDEIDALQFFYSVPYARRPRHDDIEALADAIVAPPRAWTRERLWEAYETLERDKVRGSSSTRLFTDIVSLVRFALHRDESLVPFGEQARERFDAWMAQQRGRGREFSEEQVRWLEMMRDHIAASWEIEVEDFDYAPFAEQGGRGRAVQVFGPELEELLRELNEVLAA